MEEQIAEFVQEAYMLGNYLVMWEFDNPKQYVIQSAPLGRDGTYYEEELSEIGGWPGAHHAVFDNPYDANRAWKALRLIDLLDGDGASMLFEEWIDLGNGGFPELPREEA